MDDLKKKMLMKALRERELREGRDPNYQVPDILRSSKTVTNEKINPEPAQPRLSNQDIEIVPANEIDESKQDYAFNLMKKLDPSSAVKEGEFQGKANGSPYTPEDHELSNKLGFGWHENNAPILDDRQSQEVESAFDSVNNPSERQRMILRLMMGRQ